jgi:putative methyltransferase (TIGR04325 family)
LEKLLKTLAIALLPRPWVERLRARYRHAEVTIVTPEGDTVTRPEWEMMPDEDEVWHAPAGWAHGSIAARQVEKWDSFLAAQAGALPFGRPHEAAPDAAIDVSVHNTVMTFAYLLGRIAAERRKGMPSVLDWGGGIGHYYQYARALYPATDFDYWIKDLPELCEAGAPRNPGAHFTPDEAAALSRRYDLVFASSSLHYTRDVYGLIDRLCGAAGRYLMVTRTPFVENHDDFVVVQRPHRYGYLTEYAGWFLNRPRFQTFIEQRGFVLDREFMLAERPHVGNAPEQCHYRGFLFRRHELATPIGP